MLLKAVILVGGSTKGTRFRPISLSQTFVPKPLFPIAGRPMILHQIEACAKLEGMQEIILIGFYSEELFSDFVEKSAEEFKVNIRYLHEPESLGSGGGLHFFRDLILDGGPDYVFVVHCDICCRFPLADLLEFHMKSSMITSVLGKKVPKEEARAYGCMARDEATNELLHYAEKPQTFVTDLINCGIYVLSPLLFDEIASIRDKLYLARVRGSFSESPFDAVTFGSVSKASSSNTESYNYSTMTEGMDHLSLNFMRFEQDVLAALAGKRQIGVYEFSEFWSQIKSVGAAIRCSEFYMSQYRSTRPDLLYTPDENHTLGPEIVGTVMLDGSADIHPTAKLGPNVFISAGVRIGPGVRIKHSIILDNAEIRGHACIMYAVIGWSSRVGQWVRVEGTPDYNPLSASQSMGITMFGEGVGVDSEVVVRNCIVLPHKHLSRSFHDQIIL